MPPPAPQSTAAWSMDELTRRLQETEARLEALESEQSMRIEESSLPTPPVLEPEKLEEKVKATEPAPKKKWFEKYSLRGYTQFRINEQLNLGPNSAPPHHNGDGFVGEDQTFGIRRARLVLFGDVTDHISLYFQPDFASTPPGSPDGNHFAQIRDLYFDLYLDDDKVNRFRVGQSKVPYGWENLQSSQNRLPLDRNDGFNSAVKNERDLGVFYYWTPEYAQEFFKKLSDENLKGSGNYGVFGVGVYAGQGGSLREQNDNLHFVSRLTLPITFCGGQMMELGLQGYTGEYTVLSSPISPLGVGAAVRPLGTLETGKREGIRDERLGGSIIYYPQPFGFQAEWNFGHGPGLNDAQTEVIKRPLSGGYAMAMYRHKTKCRGEFYPFVRWAYYDGGYKSERNAPYVDINEWELGLEWQINKSMEFVSMYTITDRTNTRALGTADTLSYSQFRGDLMRFQFQVNY